MRRRLTAVSLVAMVGLVACDPATMPLGGDRAAARDIALQLVADRDPVIEPAPVAQCVGASATPEEADALIAAGNAGNSSEAQAALTKILRKSNTQECLAAVGIPDFV
ncbi:MAG: hypothetical protein AAGG09_15205 [Pseudomonadota bacterium]